MNKEFIEEVIKELSYRVSNGLPDLKNNDHLIILREIFEEKGMSYELIEKTMNNLRIPVKKNPNKIDQVGIYTDFDGVHSDQAEPQPYINPIQPQDHADQDKLPMDDRDEEERDTPYTEEIMLELDYLDVDTEDEDEINEDDIVKKKETGNIYTVKSHDPKRGQVLVKKDASPEDIAKAEKGEPVEKEEEPKGTPVEPVIKGKAYEKEKAKLDKIRDKTKDADPETKKRIDILSNSWDGFINAKTYEERVENLNRLADYIIIEGHAGGKKIYLTPQAGPEYGVHYKAMTGDSGTVVTRLMNEMIKKEGISVPIRGSSADRALADMSGKYNESGVVLDLIPEDSQNYKEAKELHDHNTEEYKKLGGNLKASNETNKELADKIRGSLPEGATITDARNTGGIGAKKLMDLYGIDEKVDPTDLVVMYKDKDGKDKMMKISAKIYTDPSNITMKNSGTGNAGSHYIGGEAGKKLDEDWAKVWKENKWDVDTMDAQEIMKRKAKLKTWYTKKMGESLEQLAKTPEGQDQLENIWKEVHGCGNDVHTSVINKKTAQVDLYPPEHYCEPQQPLKVNVDGTKLIIEIDGQKNQYIQIDLKTETKSTPKLLFRHRVRKNKEK